MTALKKCFLWSGIQIQVMELAIVNDYDQAKLFFDEFNIPYETIMRGQNKGKLRVKPLRKKDGLNLIETKRRLEDMGLGRIVDHSNCFRDANDNTICTFSPYTERYVPEGPLQQRYGLIS